MASESGHRRNVGLGGTLAVADQATLDQALQLPASSARPHAEVHDAAAWQIADDQLQLAGRGGPGG